MVVPCNRIIALFPFCCFNCFGWGAAGRSRCSGDRSSAVADALSRRLRLSHASLFLAPGGVTTIRIVLVFLVLDPMDSKTLMGVALFVEDTGVDDAVKFCWGGVEGTFGPLVVSFGTSFGVAFGPIEVGSG